MRISTIKNDFFNLISFDKEVLDNKNSNRPYLIVIRLKYKGKKQYFALPFRSNISRYTPKDQYFALPPNRSTRGNNKHGLHYIKMFPVSKSYLLKYNLETSDYFKTLKQAIEKHEKEIINQAQEYLDNYANGKRTNYSVDIDGILNAITIQDTKEMNKEIAATIEKKDTF
jgi:hypothetical protein